MYIFSKSKLSNLNKEISNFLRMIS